MEQDIVSPSRNIIDRKRGRPRKADGPSNETPVTKRRRRQRLYTEKFRQKDYQPLAPFESAIIEAVISHNTGKKPVEDLISSTLQPDSQQGLTAEEVDVGDISLISSRSDQSNQSDDSYRDDTAEESDIESSSTSESNFDDEQFNSSENNLSQRVSNPASSTLSDSDIENYDHNQDHDYEDDYEDDHDHDHDYDYENQNPDLSASSIFIRYRKLRGSFISRPEQIHIINQPEQTSQSIPIRTRAQARARVRVRVRVRGWSDTDTTINRLLKHYLRPQACDKCRRRVRQLDTTTNPTDENQLLEIQSVSSESQSSNPLSVTYLINSPSEQLPQVLKSDRLLEVRPKEWTRPSEATLKELFCGLDGLSSLRRPHVDLEDERPSRCSPPRRTYDVDSLVGKIRSLAVCRTGIKLFPYATRAKNIKSNIGISEKGEYYHEESGNYRFASSDIHNIPHYLFGSVSGHDDIYIFLLFPKLFRPNRQNPLLTDAQIAFIFNNCVCPALDEVLPPDILHHIEADFDSNKDKCSAAGIEARSIKTSSYQSKKMLGYFIGPEYLKRLWSRIYHRINTNQEYPNLRFPQLILDTKNQKLLHKSSEEGNCSLLSTLDRFFTWFHTQFDQQYLDGEDFFADLGMEITPPHSVRRAGERTLGSQDYQTYFFKRCCLEHQRQALYGRRPGFVRHTFFSNYLLYQAPNMKCEPSKKSKLYKGGVRQGQWYAVHKEMLDAASTFPFQNPILEEMAIPISLRQTISKAAKSQEIPEDVIISNWNHSKRRTYNAVMGNIGKGYGVRNEHRINIDILWSLRERLKSYDENNWRRAQESSIRIPDFLWIIPTNELGTFVLENVNKFCALVEITRHTNSEYNPHSINWLRAQVIIGAVRLLRVFIHATNIATDMSLAVQYQRSARSGKMVRGLGLLYNMKDTGFGWLDDVINWAKLSIKSEYQDQMLLASTSLVSRYKAHYHEAKEVITDAQQIEMALEWLVKYNSERCQFEILLFLVHIVLRDFRNAVYQAMEKEIIVGYQYEEEEDNTTTTTNNNNDDNKEDKEPTTTTTTTTTTMMTQRKIPTRAQKISQREQFQLCYDTITAARGGKPPHLISGLGNTQIKTFDQLFDYIFGLYDTTTTQSRGRWQNFSYRQTLRSIYSHLQGYNYDSKVFQFVLKHECIRYYWLYPRPNLKELHQLDGKTHQRSWWSLVILGHSGARMINKFNHDWCEHKTPSKLRNIKDPRTGEPISIPRYAFGKTGYLTGTPPPLPECLSRSLEEWQQFFIRYS